MPTANELRQGFLDYFKGHGHAIVPSSSLIPQADPTLLFTNAGMVQFKGVFLGEERRAYTRAASSQKCIRAGGKHNDLENVGHTGRHHTFFEMLGNFSFGDYFKEEAIHFAWEYLTRVVHLSPERLWVTVYKEDDEAYTVWEKKVKIPAARLVKCGEADNFWQMADTGPCGPCSEIHYDQGPGVPGDPFPNGEGDRVMELWNLVFMQYHRDEKGALHPLPRPSIDTGMGLERLAAVVQGKTSNYDSDLFQPIIRAIGEMARKRYGASADDDRAMRVIADHLRAITFMIAEGLLPSNEGRGYVLRRILRRGARYGRLLGLGLDGPFLHRLTAPVIDLMKGPYPELERARTTIDRVTKAEEERFLDTLDKGLRLLDEIIAEAKQAKQRVIAGEALFKLYDTYGFPLDLAADSAKDHGLALDEAGFQAALNEQRERARKSAGFVAAKTKDIYTELSGIVAPTQFVGYSQLDTEGFVQAIVKQDARVKEAVEGDEIEIVLDRTPFYAEGGGQVGDQGVLTGPDGIIEVRQTTRPAPELFLHQGVVMRGRIREGDRLRAHVDPRLRFGAARNHTATHLLHAVLREVLGPHVKQYGSLVAPNRLRFDFAHFAPVRPGQLEEVEAIVNERVRADAPVQTKIMGISEAVQEGALAFFGDKYGEEVRVVEINTFSKELCGGTHCRHTGEIGLFKLVSEGGVAAGVRRIEAQTGEGAYELLKQREAELRALADILKTNPADVVTKARKLVTTLKEKEEELEKLKARLASGGAGGGGGETRMVAGVPVYIQRVDGLEMNDLRALADTVREKLKSGIVALGSVKDNKASLLVAVTKDLAARFPASELIKPAATEIGGSGGGRPEMAQAGGKVIERLQAAFDRVEEEVKRKAGA
ncbi:MAG: alanine--tRNA ligase [Nitrospirae bacterium]|nr:MAG: alanine--tRNA ligase [Nitrospirota bacterium]